MFDPEPDRAEAAQRPSTGWNVLATTAPLVDALDEILEALPGCAQGLHDWYAEFVGDPVGTPERNLAWSTLRVRCGLCGQTASLVLDEPPSGPIPDEPPVRRLVTTADIEQVLVEGKAGSVAQVQLGPLPASSLHTALRLAWDTGGAGASSPAPGSLSRPAASGRKAAELKTPDQWCAAYGVTVLDPDGWRGARDAKPWAEPVTVAEFFRRAVLGNSTCDLVNPAWEAVARDADQAGAGETPDGPPLRGGAG